MAPDLTQLSNSNSKPQFSNTVDKLLDNLYQLKKRFQTNYYGSSSGKHYDKARDFSIRLSNILYKTNRMTTKLELVPHSNILVINSEIKILEKELNELIH